VRGKRRAYGGDDINHTTVFLQDVVHLPVHTNLFRAGVVDADHSLYCGRASRMTAKPAQQLNGGIRED
jgi:hypothetical protein